MKLSYNLSFRFTNEIRKIMGFAQHHKDRTWLLSLNIMFPGFIHGVACIGPHFLLCLSNSPLFWFTTLYLSTYPMVTICVVSTFWLLWLTLLRHLSISFSVNLCFISLGYIPRSRVDRSHRIFVCNHVRKCQTVLWRT